jgi:hypothetical protein
LWLTRNFYDKEIYAGENWFDNLEIILTLVLFPSTVNNWGFGSITLTMLSLLLMIIWLISAIKNKESLRKPGMLFYLLLIEICSILFWFCLAPCPRFANGLFVILFSTSILIIKTAHSTLTLNKKPKSALLFFSFFLFLWNFNPAYSAKEFFIDGIKPLTPIPMRTFITQSGLKLLLPPKGIAQCWDSPILSTIEPKYNLALIGSNIEDGFYLINNSN